MLKVVLVVVVFWLITSFLVVQGTILSRCSGCLGLQIFWGLKVAWGLGLFGASGCVHLLVVWVFGLVWGVRLFWR